MAMARMSAGQVDKSEEAHQKALPWSEARKTVLNPVVLLCSFFYICNNVTVQGLGTFVPTILRLNYPGISTVQVQLLSAPPFAFVTSFEPCRNPKADTTSILQCCLGRGHVCSLLRHEEEPARSGLHVRSAPYDHRLHNLDRHRRNLHQDPLRSHLHQRFWVNPALHTSRSTSAMLTSPLSFSLSGFYGPLILAWALSNASTDSARALTGATVSGLGGIGSIVASWSYSSSPPFSPPSRSS